MHDPALAAHRLDKRFRAEISGIENVGAEAERRLGRILGASGERDRRGLVCGELIYGGIDSDRVARKNAKAIVALSHQAFDQLRLQVEFPLGRHLEVDSGDAKLLLCVGGGLLPGSEIRMRAPGDERDLIAGSFRAAGENGERRRKDPQYANRTAFHRFSSPSSKALCRFWSAGDWRRLRIWHAIVVCKASGTAASERPRRRRVRPPPPPRRRAEGVDLRKAEAPARHGSTRPRTPAVSRSLRFRRMQRNGGLFRRSALAAANRTGLLASKNQGLFG